MKGKKSLIGQHAEKNISEDRFQKTMQIEAQAVKKERKKESQKNSQCSICRSIPNADEYV